MTARFGIPKFDESLSAYIADSSEDPDRFMRLAEGVPITGEAPEDPDERSTWALEGLRKWYARVPFRNEDNSLVRELSSYQKDIWRCRWEVSKSGVPKTRLVIKGQKIGVSILCLSEIFHIAMSPRAWGREIIIASQNALKAEEHLRDLKIMIRQSRYRDFLVESAPRTREGKIRRDTLSRSNLAVIVNPESPADNPTRVWAVGITAGAQLLSNKTVVHLHLSDVTAADATSTSLDRNIHKIRSRIVKSEGTMITETLPGSPNGYIYGQYREAVRAQAAAGGTDLRKLLPGPGVHTASGVTWRLPWSVAVNEGVLKRRTIDREREHINNDYEFARLYEADFLAGSMVAYSNPVVREDDEEAGKMLELGMSQTGGGI